MGSPSNSQTDDMPLS